MADTQPTHIENWRPIEGYEGFYEVSDHGNVRSLDRIVEYSDGRRVAYPGKVLALDENSASGYLQIKLRSAHHYIHQLALEAFVGPCPEGMEVCHNDGNPKNNHLSNLRYGTKSDNAQDRMRHGTQYQVNKTHCPQGHELAEPNLVAFNAKKGHRSCLACARARAHVQYHKHLKPHFQMVADKCLEKILREAASV